MSNDNDYGEQLVKSHAVGLSARLITGCVWSAQYTIGFVFIFKNFIDNGKENLADEGPWMQWLRVLAIAILFFDLTGIDDSCLAMKLSGGYKYVTLDRSPVSRASVLACNILSVLFFWVYPFSYVYHTSPFHESLLGLCMVNMDFKHENMNDSKESESPRLSISNAAFNKVITPIKRLDSSIGRQLSYLERQNELQKQKLLEMERLQEIEALNDEARRRTEINIVKSVTPIIRSRSSSRGNTPRFVSTGSDDSEKTIRITTSTSSIRSNKRSPIASVPVINQPLFSPANRPITTVYGRARSPLGNSGSSVPPQPRRYLMDQTSNRSRRGGAAAVVQHPDHDYSDDNDDTGGAMLK